MSLRRPKIQIKPKVSLRSMTPKTANEKTCNQSSDSINKSIDSSAKELSLTDQLNDSSENVVTPVVTTTQVIGVSREQRKEVNDMFYGNGSQDTSLQNSNEVMTTSSKTVDKNVSKETIQSNEGKDNKLIEINTKTSKSEPKSKSNRKRKMSRSGQKSDKSVMRMKDLLVYNPPMTDEQKEMRDKDAEQSDVTTNVESSDKSRSKSETEDILKDLLRDSTDGANAGPRVKVGTDGNLILDEESVVVKRNKNEAINETTLLESAVTTSALTNYSSFRTKTKSSSKPRWTEHETIRFYSALNTIGTDFTLMANLFFRGKRTRLDLRNKFKKEEKVNKLMIDEALFSPNTFINQCPELDNLLDDSSDSDDDDIGDQNFTNKQKATKSKS